MQSCLAAQRRASAGAKDAYWAVDSPFLDARVEAAALSKLLAETEGACEAGAALQEELLQLCDSYCERVGAPSSASPSSTELSSAQPFTIDSAELALKRSYAERGLQSCVSPAQFLGGLRGLAADRNIGPGEVVITVPSALLLSYHTARDSDLGKVLQRLPDLDEETVAVIWAMVERYDDEGDHAAWWAALPHHFRTGLSVDDAEVESLVGSALYTETRAARQHLHHQHAALWPVFESLVRAYPAHLRAELFTLPQFLWAAELWYAYAIQVQFPDGSVSPCLVPYLSLMNHSPWPHVVHFSRIHPDSSCLRVTTFRSCAAGQQLFLSYGPLPNAKLLLFYGFAVPHNPFDELLLSLEVLGDQPDLRRRVLRAASLPLEYALRAAGDIPPTLLRCIRVLSATAEQLPRLLSQLDVAPSGVASPGRPAGGAQGAGGNRKKNKGKGRAGGGAVTGGRGGGTEAVGTSGRGAEASGGLTEEAVEAALLEVCGAGACTTARTTLHTMVAGLLQDEGEEAGCAPPLPSSDTGVRAARVHEAAEASSSGGDAEASAAGVDSRDGNGPTQSTSGAFSPGVQIYLRGQRAILRHALARTAP